MTMAMMLVVTGGDDETTQVPSPPIYRPKYNDCYTHSALYKKHTDYLTWRFI
jgi:hypothetical protein